MAERVQKLLAASGLGSRRSVERVIADGGVNVNGRTAGLGDRIDAGDRVTVGGRRYRVESRANPQTRVLAYHKPEGEVCTRSDEQGRATVFDNLPGGRRRWIIIGRLDINTSGLLLFTDNGELAHRMMHPSGALERVYAVRIFGRVDESAIAQLRQGVQLEDGPARFERIEDAGGRGANHWYHVTLREGRNHEVRRLWASQGITVSRLIRIAYGPISLDPRLRPGHSKRLDEVQTRVVLESAGLADGGGAQLYLRPSKPGGAGTRRRR